MLMTDPRPGKQQILFPLDPQCSLNIEGLQETNLTISPSASHKVLTNKLKKYVHVCTYVCMSLWVCIYNYVHTYQGTSYRKKKKTYNSARYCC